MEACRSFRLLSEDFPSLHSLSKRAPRREDVNACPCLVVAKTLRTNQLRGDVTRWLGVTGDSPPLTCHGSPSERSDSVPAE